MIAPGVSSSAICLRCRLRLLRQSSQPFHASSRIFRLQHPGLRRFATESPARAVDPDRVVEGQGHAPGSEEQAQDGSPGSRENQYGAKRRDVRKRRLSRNRILTEDAQNLESDMLGKPASVIVMRDGGLYRKKGPPLAPDSPESEPDNQPTDIEALLNSQREPPNPEEVRENIDGLRPKTEKALSEREFRKLQSLLTDGFLSAQLQDYLDYLDESSHADTKLSDEKDPASKYGWIREISPWVPLTGQSGDVVEGIAPSLYGYVTDSTTAKDKLAIRIMRECWGLSMAELDAGLGETRLKIRAHEFILLMRGTQRWVTVMGKIWLEPGEKIEAFRNKNTLRLVTTKTKAATLIKDLNTTLNQVTTMSFAVNLVTSKPIDDAVLEEVGRITNTHIRRSHSLRRLHVTWIELKKRASKGLLGLEDLRQVVFRLLLTAYTPQPATTATLRAAGQDEGVTGRFITDMIDKEKLGWKDRMGQWARYTLPLTLEGGDSEARSPLERLELPVKREAVPPKFDENKEFFPDTPFPVHPVKWAEDLQVSTKASFGYLLHAHEPSTSPPPLPNLLAANHPRVFVPITPHPLHLAKLEAIGNEAANGLVQTKTTIVIRFWPSPAGGDQQEMARNVVTPPAPLLELRLATSDGEIKGIESVRAIKQTRITDVMLPASLVDLRYTQAQYAVLKGDPGKLAAWQPLADFLEPARLDLAHGKFEVPPHQRFPIPRRLFNYDVGLGPNTTTNSSELIKTSYTFVGLEIHRSVSMPYEGFRLTYTSIDAKLGRGRRAEISLDPGLESEVSTIGENTDKLHRDFLATCQNFARTDALWSGYLATRRGP
ncbi:mitochondrial inner-membrane-bound regulator-domain-containing protein [Hypoxylon sp. FL1857]|nr:mitochondrial inner-membrane-bound regulator-domain-containing protein [Hypoxylon sp. FL1857]